MLSFILQFSHPLSHSLFDYRKNDRLISEAAQNARKGGGSKDMSMEAEQTAWLSSNNVPTTNSDAKYTWHVAPETKVRFMCCCVLCLCLCLWRI